MLDKIIVGGLTCFVLYLLGITAIRITIDRIVDNYKQSSEENEDTVKDESLKERIAGYKEWLEGNKEFVETHVHTWKKGIVGNGKYILTCTDRACGKIEVVTKEQFDAR